MRGTKALSPLYVVASLLLLSCGAGVPAPRALPSWARALPEDQRVLPGSHRTSARPSSLAMREATNSQSDSRLI